MSGVRPFLRRDGKGSSSGSGQNQRMQTQSIQSLASEKRQKRVRSSKQRTNRVLLKEKKPDLRDENVEEIGGRRSRGTEFAEDGEDEIVR